MKYLILVLVVSVLLASCAVKDREYYQLHPQEMQQAIQNCPGKHPEGLTCEALRDLAIKFNQLASELQSSPQEFGKEILKLQQKIAVQKNMLQAKTSDKNTESTLERYKKNLAYRLNMVKLFESPRR